ncbi:MAG: hypothetical protein JXB88_04180 [Spirochaetales bacterium]|nr:hypothetical protein [Spirochaetales bacterium]
MNHTRQNNKELRLFSLLFLILFVFTPCAAALESHLSVEITSDWVTGTIKAEALDTGMIASSLEEGLASEIIFQFRVYKINRSLFSFLGDQLVLEKRLSSIAFKDFFLNQYVIRTEGYSFRYFEIIDDFINSYSVLSKCHLIETSKITPYDYYIMARVSSYPVKLDPPLHIIAIFGTIGRTSPWVEYRFIIQEEGEF